MSEHAWVREGVHGCMHVRVNSFVRVIRQTNAPHVRACVHACMRTCVITQMLQLLVEGLPIDDLRQVVSESLAKCESLAGTDSSQDFAGVSVAFT